MIASIGTDAISQRELAARKEAARKGAELVRKEVSCQRGGEKQTRGRSTQVIIFCWRRFSSAYERDGFKAANSPTGQKGGGREPARRVRKQATRGANKRKAQAFSPWPQHSIAWQSVSHLIKQILRCERSEAVRLRLQL